MRKFRRSTNRSEDKLSMRLTPKDASAIQPPKKVICATHPYQPPADQTECLPFHAGDFFHVVDREDDANWYEVLDLKGKRGLVPRVFFDDVGKKDLRSKEQYDSGYSDGTASNRASVGGPEAAEAARKMSVSSDRGLKLNMMIYGVVMYDFNSERPDELDAKAGDHVIIIAQSNPEWFVAKPISKLGGPGLIPVAFIEIRNSVTNQAVPDMAEAIRAAGIPKVEEWKQRAAWYKNNSVPLGTLSHARSQDLEQGMERMSVATARTAGTMTSARGVSYWARDSGMNQRSTLQATSPSNDLTTPVSARVAGFSQVRMENGIEYFFHVEVNNVDGRAWSLRRPYKEFWETQMHLLDQFPEASGRVEGKKRTLPNLPGPVPFTSENLTRQRLPHIDDYLRKVLRVNPQISNSQPLKILLAPREGDQEMAPFDDNEMDRTSQLSQQSSQREYSAQSSTTSLSERTGSYASPTRQQPSQQYAYPNKPAPQPHYRSPSELAVPNGYQNGVSPSMLRNNGGLSNGSSGAGSLAQRVPDALSASSAQNAVIKIKVFLPSDNCILLRMPGNFGFDELMTKVRERYLLEPERHHEEDEDVELAINYKDEDTMIYYPIKDEKDLTVARERNDKLTLKVYVV